MIQLLSQSVQNYSGNVVQIGDKKYSNVHSVDTRRYTDTPDKKEKAVSYIQTNDAEYSVYLENNKVVLTTKKYNRLVSKKLGSKVYNNITLKKIHQDGTQIYETINPRTYAINKIIVTPDGTVQNNAVKTLPSLLEKIVKPIKKLIKP